MRRDLVFAIASPKWDTFASPNRDTFASWEWNAERHASYLGDSNWDRLWVPEASSSDNDEDDNEDDKEEGVGVKHEKPPPPPAQVTGEVSDQIYNSKVVHDDTDDMIDHVAYHILRVAERGDHFELPPELTEEEELKVAIIATAEEEKRAFPGYYDALALSMAPPPGSSPPQPPRTPPRPRRDARNEVWDAWLGAAPPTIGWLPPPPPGPQSPPMAAWPWPQAPLIDLSGDDDDENGRA
jgi:hypothetical protein